MKGKGFIPQPMRGYKLVINGSKYYDGSYVWSDGKWLNSLFNLGEGCDVNCGEWEMVAVVSEPIWMDGNQCPLPEIIEDCAILTYCKDSDVSHTLFAIDDKTWAKEAYSCTKWSVGDLLPDKYWSLYKLPKTY